MHLWCRFAMYQMACINLPLIKLQREHKVESLYLNEEEKSNYTTSFETVWILTLYSHGRGAKTLTTQPQKAVTWKLKNNLNYYASKFIFTTELLSEATFSLSSVEMRRTKLQSKVTVFPVRVKCIFLRHLHVVDPKTNSVANISLWHLFN